ncbi:MAG: hypothetical protein FJ255_00875 [Phycisphaerae bacterium]|nr:hypothetical protein [Phycisphaerae bacterium]
MPEPYRPRPPLDSVRLAKPKRVRGGIKLAGDAPSQRTWAAQRVLRLLEGVGKGENLVEGLAYARMGQTKRWVIEAGRVTAVVQGRSLSPYTTALAISAFNDEQWREVLGVLAAQAGYAARLLAREVPASVEEAFAPLGLRLCPTEAGDVTPTCTCARPDAADPWCKHACCVLALLAEQMDQDPFAIFTLRGMPVDDLLEQLHRRRSAASPGGASASVYPTSVPGLSDVQAPTLDQALESFWVAGPGLRDLDLPIDPPKVSHPLLRRLGPSPVPGGQFPFVGLMATCYELMSESAIRRELGEEAPALRPEDADDASRGG